MVYNNHIEASEYRKVETMNRNEIARAAFWGNNEALMNYMCSVDSYTWNGVEYPANGITLARAIEIMENLSSDEIDALIAVGIISE